MKYLLLILLITFNVFSGDDFRSFETPVKGVLPYFKHKDISPTWKKTNDRMKIKKYTLESQLKDKFGDKDMKGKVSVVNFFFATCQGYCPRMTSNIKRAFKHHKGEKGVNFISYSVTPNIDTKETLKEYAKRTDIANSNWHLVRGDRDTIYNLARKQLQADLEVDLKKDEDQFVHSENVYLIDQDLYVRGIYNSASKREMNELSEDISKLLKKK